ncbi:MarR family transcriptional regulator, partial [Dysosmobacter sp.]|uniref:MarR family winged helix-turn-helix transcriptional regulator n=2 Tax=Dysosmobacter sp. TaxID=2591382 RepID=UPI00307E3682
KILFLTIDIPLCTIVLNRTLMKGEPMHFWDQHKTITRYYEILMSSVCEKHQLKHLEYDILMFLHNNPQYRTAADIVRVRKSTKSHVSTSLKTLEDRGLIAKKTDPVNKKHIELDLLEPANEIVQDGLLAQRQFAEQMLRGLTPEDIAVCKRIFQQVCSNAEACIKQKG